MCIKLRSLIWGGKEMTDDEEEIDKLVEDLKKDGVNVVAYGTAKDLLKLMEEGEFSDKIKDESK